MDINHPLVPLPLRAVLFLASLLAVPRSHAASGDLDLSFGGTGMVSTTLPGFTTAGAQGVTVQSDGKIVAVGSSTIGEFSAFAVVRYNADGTLDTNFNGTGIVTTTELRSNDNGASGVAMQSDGKILAAGSSYSPPNHNFAVMRYNTDGSLDTTFNGDGVVTTDLSGIAAQAHSIAVQPDGKIVVAGLAGNSTVVVRYNTDGSLDSTFNGSGRVTPGLYCYGMAVQPDGKIVVTGGLVVTVGEHSTIAVERYNADGSLDTTFNGNGTATAAFGGGKSVAVHHDGKIVVAGILKVDGGYADFSLVRFNANGTLDVSFNNTGVVAGPFGNGATGSYSNSLAVQDNGKIVVAGTVTSNANHFAMARYNVDGSLDTGFNGSGKIISDSNGYCHGVALQRDGRILAAGQAGQGFAVARYIGDYPDIAVSQPPGRTLVDGSAAPVDFGFVSAGSSASRTFSIENQGASDLSILSVTKSSTGTPDDFTLGPLGAMTLAPGASTTFAVTFSPAGPGVRTATLLIASNDEDENPFEINLTGTQATPLEAWRQTYFGSPYNTGDGADLSDPEGDGVVNLMEFATGSDPKGLTPPIGQLVKNGITLEFTYSRPKAALTELRYDLEASVSLSGTWSKVGQAESILLEDGATQQVRATHPAGGTGKRFVRLRVTRR